MAGSETGTMRAVRQAAWGGLEELELVEADRPRVLPTEILVRVHAAGVNPVDVFTREGRAYVRALSLPYVPGWDVSGVVEAVGYGVTRFAVGDAVFGMPWFPRQGGTYAEYVSAPARHFAHKPDGLTHEEAASLPLAGLSAWQMLNDIAAVRPGQKVLVNAAAGGVGHLAVQIAKAHGAEVTAIASTPKHAFVRSLGADAVIDYTSQDPAKVLRGFDVVIELIGGETCLSLLRTLRPGGLLVSAQAAWAPGLQEEAGRLGVRASWYLVEPDAKGLEALATLVADGKLRPHVQDVFPLEAARDAQALVASGRTQGKVVLSVAGGRLS
jgi:NADPH:quinone reductase-like Zn-dependent oxidoreductase